MMSYAEFVEKVQRIDGGHEKWLHILPSIHMEHRQRYLDVLNRGLDMPKAYDLILLSKDLNDEQFRAKLNDLP